jgi:hypothetical protein
LDAFITADYFQYILPISRKHAADRFGLIVVIGWGFDSHTSVVFTIRNLDRCGLATFNPSEHKRTILWAAVQRAGINQSIVEPD